MENSKKTPGKITPFGERIIKVLKINNLAKNDGTPNYSKAERLCGIKGSALSKAVKGNSMHDGNLEKFLGKFQIKRDWLLSGIGPMNFDSEENISTQINENGLSIEKAIKTVADGNTKEYTLIPKSLLQDKHRLISLEQMADNQKIIDRLLDQNQKLIEEIMQLKTQLPTIQKR